MSGPLPLAKIALPLGVLMAGALGAYWLVATQKAPQQVVEPERLLRVTATRASPRSVQVDVQARGRVVEARRIQLRPQIAGPVIWVADTFEPGALVQKGEVLLRIDPADYRLAVVDRKAAVAEARLALRLAQGQRKVSERSWRLFGEQGPDRESADSALARHIPQVEAAQEQLAAAESRLRLARLDLNRTRITAPFDGTIIEKQVDLGEYVTPQHMLAAVAGTDRYWVEAAVETSRLAAIKFPDPEAGEEGSSAVVWQDIGGKRIEREGRVIRLVKTLSQEGNMAQLLIQVDDPLGLRGENKGPPLLLGAFVSAAIEAAPLEEVIPIPRHALHEGDYVLVVSEADELERQEVDVAWFQPDEVLIRGVDPDVRIVTSRLTQPIPGTKVEVLEEARREAAEATLRSRRSP